MLDLIEDKSFDLNKTNQYKLSIQLSLNGFSFFVIDSQENKLLAYKNVELTISHHQFIARRLQELIKIEKILQKKYQKVEAILYENNFALIPNDFYILQNTKDLSLKVLEDFSKEKMLTNDVASINHKVLFPVYIELETVLKANFDAFTIVHPIEKLHDYVKNIEQENCYLLHFYDNSFYLLEKQNNEVTLTNNFTYKSTEDVLFYLKTVLNAKKSIIYTTGNYKEKEAIHYKISDYIGNIKELPYSTISYPNNFDIEKGKFLTLF